MPDSHEHEPAAPASNHEHPPELHGHEHVHKDTRAHRHPHHHGPDAHDHAHTVGYERYTYLVSPLHDLDPRFKIISALSLIIGVVAGPTLRPIEFALLLALLGALVLISGVPLRWIFGRAALVLPIALGIALFSPLGRMESLSWIGARAAYAENWLLVWGILSKAWFSAFTVLLVSSTTPLPRILKALEWLKLPDVFLTLLTFLYRFTDVFAEQLRSMRRAVASRAPGMSPRRTVSLYGNLAGSLFIRAYERGERIFAAMLSRGYTGVLPSTETFTVHPADWLTITTTLLVVAAVLLY